MSATIAARAHTNATLSAPARRAKPGRGPASRFAGLARMVARRPGRAVVMLLFAVIAGAILVNALVFQKTRHPAPIVAAPSAVPARAVERRVDQPSPSPVATAAPTATPAPLPPSRPSDLPQAARETAPRPPAAVANVPRTAAVAAPAAAPVRAPAPRDPIADLINGAEMRPPAEIRGGASAKSAAARRTAEN